MWFWTVSSTFWILSCIESMYCYNHLVKIDTSPLWAVFHTLARFSKLVLCWFGSISLMYGLWVRLGFASVVQVSVQFRLVFTVLVWVVPARVWSKDSPEPCAVSYTKFRTLQLQSLWDLYFTLWPAGAPFQGCSGSWWDKFLSDLQLSQPGWGLPLGQIH